MARIRSIKPEFWTSEEVAACGPLTRLLFIGLWSFADDGGNHPVQVSALKVKIFPYDSEINSATVLRMLGELATNTLLRFYQAIDGKQYFHITGWKHQKIDKPSFKFPKPKDDGSVAIEFKDIGRKNSTSPRLPFGEASPADILSLEGEGTGSIQSSPTTEFNSEPPRPSERASPAPSAPAPADNALRVFDAWNKMAAESDLAVARELTPERRSKISQRIKDHRGDVDVLLGAIGKIQASDFCRGRGGGDRRWKADLDFMLQRKSLTKLIEGSFDNTIGRDGMKRALDFVNFASEKGQANATGPLQSGTHLVDQRDDRAADPGELRPALASRQRN